MSSHVQRKYLEAELRKHRYTHPLGYGSEQLVSQLLEDIRRSSTHFKRLWKILEDTQRDCNRLKSERGAKSTSVEIQTEETEDNENSLTRLKKELTEKDATIEAQKELIRKKENELAMAKGQSNPPGLPVLPAQRPPSQLLSLEETIAEPPIPIVTSPTFGLLLERNGGDQAPLSLPLPPAGLSPPPAVFCLPPAPANPIDGWTDRESAMMSDVANLTTQLMETEHRLQEAMAALHAAKSAAHLECLATQKRLETELLELRTAEAELRGRLQGAADQSLLLSNEVTELDTSRTLLEIDVAKMKEDLSTRDEIINRLQMEMENHQALADITLGNLADAESRAEEGHRKATVAESNISDIQQSLCSLQEENSKLQNEKQSVEEKLKSFRTKLAQISTALETSSLSAKQQEDRLVQLEDESKLFAEEKKRLVDALSAERAKVQYLSEQVDFLVTHLEKLKKTPTKGH